METGFPLDHVAFLKNMLRESLLKEFSGTSSLNSSLFCACQTPVLLIPSKTAGKLLVFLLRQFF